MRKLVRRKHDTLEQHTLLKAPCPDIGHAPGRPMYLINY